MTILMVDDDIGCIELWTRMLSNLNARLIFSESVEGALRRMQEISPPDLVLLDLRIPPYDAAQSLEAINAFRQFNPNLAVIAISGMRMEEILVAIKAAGVIVQGAITKEDAMSQTRLMGVVKSAMVKDKTFKDTVETLEQVNSKVCEAQEKKRTGEIKIPKDEAK